MLARAALQVARAGIGATRAASNRGVVYLGPWQVEVQPLPYPKLEVDFPDGPRACHHGAILRVVTTNICGSDLHMYRGRTSVTPGTVFGHEITGEVIEAGRDVEYIKSGDIVSVPFNVACGRCDNCKARHTEACLNVNPLQPGGAYGYAEMGPWQGGQAEYVMVPYADFQLLKFPDRSQALKKIKDLTLLSDVFPTGYHGAVTAGVTTGSTVYVAGAGPVGLCAAASSKLLGASAVIVGDVLPDRLDLARAMGCHTADLTSEIPLAEQIQRILGSAQLDCGIDCVGYEAHGCGHKHDVEVPEQVLMDMMTVTKATGMVGIPGVYMKADPGAADKAHQQGLLSLRFGMGWTKGLTFSTGQCPVMKYHKPLMMAILNDQVQLAKACNVQVIGLDEAPAAYQDYAKGAPKKYVIDPHGMTKGL